MFSKQRLMNGKLQLVLVLALALAMLVPALTADAASSATTSGDFCVDGLVIDWEEEVIEEGWFVEALPVDENGNVISSPLLVAKPSEEDDEEGQFEFKDEQFRDADGNLISKNWEFTIDFTTGYTVTRDSKWWIFRARWLLGRCDTDNDQSAFRIRRRRMCPYPLQTA